MMPTLNYVELPSGDVAVSKRFYGTAFGWDFTDYGPEYVAVEGGPTDIGFNASEDQRIGAILPIIETDDLEGARAAVISAGGTISIDIFSYPGGRRFHFSDPHGNLLGVYQKAEG